MKLLKNKLAVTVIVLSVSFLILIGYSIKREKGTLIENGVGLTLNGVQGFIYNSLSSAKDYINFMANFSIVKQENEELKKKNAELNSKALAYDTAIKRNAELENMVNFKSQHSSYDYIGCSISGKTGNDVLDGFTINRGKRDGVAVGMPVITSQGLVGQVTLATDNYSQIQSIANENVQVAALDQNTGENNGVIKGFRDNDNRMLSKLYKLPLKSEIKKGDVILTSGIGQVYPAGIAIGKVIEVDEDSVKVEKNALVEPYVNFDKLQDVFVIVPKAKGDKGEIKY